jgi:hypothetical protein
VIYFSGSFRGAFLFFRPRAFIFSLFLRVVGGNALARKAPRTKQTQTQFFEFGQNGGNWPIPASEFLQSCRSLG